MSGTDLKPIAALTQLTVHDLQPVRSTTHGLQCVLDWQRHSVRTSEVKGFTYLPRGRGGRWGALFKVLVSSMKMCANTDHTEQLAGRTKRVSFSQGY